MRMVAPKSAVLAFLAILVGCSAALVPETSDPQKKIQQAYQLMNSGRAIPAEKLAMEASEIYERERDYVGAGVAASVLGMLYTSPAYRSAEKYYRDQGTYDPTPKKSMSYFRESVELYKKGGDYWGAANALIGIGDGYTNQGNSPKACEAYTQALSTYKDPEAKFSGVAYSWNPKYPSYEAMLEALVAKACGQTSSN